MVDPFPHAVLILQQTRAAILRMFMIFFFAFFFSIRSTDPISENAFDGKREKKRAWPYTIERLSGHVIENLNIYEVQKQTCKIIIANHNADKHKSRSNG